jgi:hypothetical protein
MNSNAKSPHQNPRSREVYCYDKRFVELLHNVAHNPKNVAHYPPFNVAYLEFCKENSELTHPPSL